MFRFIIFDRDWLPRMDRGFRFDGDKITITMKDNGKEKENTPKIKLESMQLIRGLVHSMSNLMEKTKGNRDSFIIECTFYQIFFFSSPLIGWKFCLLREDNYFNRIPPKPSTQRPPSWIIGIRKDDVLKGFYINEFTPFYSQSPFIADADVDFDSIESFTNSITNLLIHFPCK